MNNQRPVANRSELKVGLDYQGVYPCPVCRHGQISGLLMVDAFACNFCRHIFTANLADQSLHLEDSHQPFRWQWTGYRWRLLRSQEIEVTLTLWLIAIALILLPPGLIWLTYHTFPPLPTSHRSWFPLFWLGLVFITHSGLVFWLLLEHYQFPAYVAWQIRWQRWFNQ
uniref:Uncharacterized protein n=1 Tax=Cyanothece sp. (strain PCC 7425 / ATCC 29141) TaxID=395961 RepID=B8HU34_CYAP4